MYAITGHQNRLLLAWRKAGATVESLENEYYENFEIPVPPRDLQQAIADFLDRKTEQIDTLIEKKQRMIELLEEKRQALITQTVTKGLDPNVPMKDTGIEWIGIIPRHWNALKIKRLSIVNRGASPRPIGDPQYFDEDGERVWVRIADVTASGKYLTTTTQRLSKMGQARSVQLDPGSLFLSIAGSVGKPVITSIKCCIHDGFVYFPRFKGDTEFLYYVFACGRPYLGLGKLGTQLNLNTDIVGDIVVPFPSEEEQYEISAYLRQQTCRLDNARKHIQDQITRLREYRQSLISAAVTGKIDVTEEAA